MNILSTSKPCVNIQTCLELSFNRILPFSVFIMPHCHHLRADSAQLSRAVGMMQVLMDREVTHATMGGTGCVLAKLSKVDILQI